MEDLMLRIEQALRMIEEKEVQDYSDMIIFDLLTDIKEEIRKEH